MAVYKVPQDVEADDKLVGPFTFKRLLFLFIAGVIIFVAYQVMIRTSFWFGLMFVPPLALFLVLGLWPSRHQPIEVYLTAVVRFYFKNHTRIWQQTGIVDRVTIHAPKHVEKRYTDGRDTQSVETNLKKIANLMNTRGWNQKNMRVNPHESSSVGSEDVFAEGSNAAASFDQALGNRQQQQAAYLDSLAQGANSGQVSQAAYPAVDANRYFAGYQPAAAQPGYATGPSISPGVVQNTDLSVASLAREAGQANNQTGVR